MHLRSFPRGGVLAAALAMGSAGSAGAVPIAEWRFEPGNFLADSSGNGHDLSNGNGTAGTTATPSTASPGAFSAGSADFDGGDILRTVSTLDLSGFSAVTLTWYQFVDNGKVAIMFEHSVDTNTKPGGFELTVNEVSTNNTSTGVGRPVLRTTSGYNGDDQTHAIGSWEQFTMAIDLTATPASQIVEVTNGVERNLSSDVAPFRNDFFHLGNRFSNLGLGLLGNIDEFRIDGTPVPEPGALSLLCAGGVAVLAGRRRAGGRFAIR